MDAERDSAEAPVSSATVQPSGAGSTENVDRIREILFGSQMREYGQRFARLEEQLLRETGELKAEIRRRLDSLEDFTKQEFESLSSRLKTERTERTESVERVSREANDRARELERRLAQSDEQAARNLGEFRHLVLERQKGLSDELTQCVSRSEMLQNRRLEELRASTADRMALANLLAEVALRLRGESVASGVEDALSAGASR